MTTSDEFDIFLSHNSRDKEIVRQLAEHLRTDGLNVWLDEEQLVPGRTWQEAIEAALDHVKSVGILIGHEGLGPWEVPEMRVSLLAFFT